MLQSHGRTVVTHPAAAQTKTDKETYKAFCSKDKWRVNDCKARECRLNPGALVGLAAEKVKERCGIIYRVSRTATATRTTEQWIYEPFRDGILAVHFEAGVVTAASSY